MPTTTEGLRDSETEPRYTYSHFERWTVPVPRPRSWWRRLLYRIAGVPQDASVWVRRWRSVHTLQMARFLSDHIMYAETVEAGDSGISAWGQQIESEPQRTILVPTGSEPQRTNLAPTSSSPPDGLGEPTP